MNSPLPRLSHLPVPRLSCLLLAFVLGSAAVFTAGCGGPALSGNTTVTVLTASTANDEFFQFSATMNTLTLTSQSGKTVSLLSAPVYPEFIHVNGAAEPLATVSVPQDIYTSATASFGPTGFTCATVNPVGMFATAFFGSDAVSGDNVTFNLPAPITITGASMGLSLDLLVSQSAGYTSCYTTGIEPFTLTPTFSVTPVTISGRPTSSANGKFDGLEGVVASINSTGNLISVNSVELSNYGGTDPGDSIDPANGPNWQVAFSDSTVFQGITGSSQLAAGMAVDMDAAVQADGSLMATRIAVYDTNNTDVSLWVAPLLYVYNGEPRLNVGEREGIGPVLAGDGAPVDFSSSTFNISEQLTNVASLPFHAGFAGTNMVSGQNIGLTFHYPGGYPGGDNGAPATTVTLLPQTINGTVSATSSSGGFTTYTITLAPYDLFPALAVQDGQTTMLTNPSEVVVYVEGSTQLLNTGPVAVGGVFRFYGLVFNDNGTLRMDCAQIYDGVAE